MTSTELCITLLVDNVGHPGLEYEHGLSMWIEHGGKHFLFDTGETDILVRNAEVLGIDLSKTDFIILSHGHSDHTGGISSVLKAAPCATVFCHPGVFLPRYSRKKSGKYEAIHMPPASKLALHQLPMERLRWVQNPLQLTGSMGLTGSIPRLNDYEDTGGDFFLDPQGQAEDRIMDDIALWIRTDQGLVVVSGCAHSGIINTVSFIKTLVPSTKIRALAGGFHLVHASARRMEKTEQALRLLAPEHLIACHCTGELAVARLEAKLGESVSVGHVGLQLKF